MQISERRERSARQRYLATTGAQISRNIATMTKRCRRRREAVVKVAMEVAVEVEVEVKV